MARSVGIDPLIEDERIIESILLFRNDISPFLAHLTRNTTNDASQNLESILHSKCLKYGAEPMSDGRWGFNVHDLDLEVERKYFSAVSFTETPLGELHNLLEIKGRRIHLQPYGVVFVKDRLKKKGVSPVFYLNNLRGDKDRVMEALCSLITTFPNEASQILPYLAFFGKSLQPVGGTKKDADIDFTWEREWRYASTEQKFEFDENDLFIGLCPHEQIRQFERRFDWLQFIDPRRNMKWYAEKLVEARQRLDLKFSVV